VKKNFLFVLIIFIGITSYSQTISVDNGTWATKSNSVKGKYGDINYNYHGKYFNNLFGSIYAFDVNYKDSVNNKLVFVKYAISIIGDNQHFELDQASKTLKLIDKAAKLSVFGFITAMTDGEKDTLVTFSDVDYMIGDKRFKAWVVAKNSKIGTSNTTNIIKTGLHSSKNVVDFSGQKVALFQIEKDFSLSFVAKPISLETAVNTTVPKK